MLSYEEALEQVRQLKVDDLPQEMVNLEALLGRVVASSQYSAIDVPPFANSAMDGYAVSSTGFKNSTPYKVSQRIKAGDAPDALEPGSVARIFTGAPIPQNADSVVIQENARVEDDGTVTFGGEFRAGQHVRPAGGDIQNGALLIEKGERINARGVGLLANAGIAAVSCFRRPRVTLLSTGNEIKKPGETLESGQIYNSNYYMLHAELSALGADVIETDICTDSAETTRDALRQAAKESDAVITIGGMSVGEEDYVREQAEALGDLNFWKVAIKPGKPLGFGRIGGALFFGLPGNPVSSFVTFFLFAKPALKKLMGISHCGNDAGSAIADFEYHNNSARREFVRVRLKAGSEPACLPKADIFRTQSSGVLSSLMYADALAVVHPRQEVSAGDVLTVFPLNQQL